MIYYFARTISEYFPIYSRIVKSSTNVNNIKTKSVDFDTMYCIARLYYYNVSRYECGVYGRYPLNYREVVHKITFDAAFTMLEYSENT